MAGAPVAEEENPFFTFTGFSTEVNEVRETFETLFNQMGFYAHGFVSLHRFIWMDHVIMWKTTNTDWPSNAELFVRILMIFMILLWPESHGNSQSMFKLIWFTVATDWPLDNQLLHIVATELLLDIRIIQSGQTVPFLDRKGHSIRRNVTKTLRL